MSRRLVGEVVLATHNRGKIAELKGLLEPFDLQVFTAPDLGLRSPPETGESCLENAVIKARAAAEKAQKPALADDCGFFVDALNGEPGIYLSRWSKQAGGWVEGMELLLQVLRDKGCMNANARGAVFRCALAVAWPDGLCVSAEGERVGIVTEARRGDKGAGFDPLFLPNGHARTYGEMEAAERDRVNHRADAFARLQKICLNSEA